MPKIDKVGEQQQNSSLGEVALSFLTTLSLQEREDSLKEVNRFVLWYSKERPVNQLVPSVVASYADWIAASSADASSKLEPVRRFLTYVKKEGFTETNLAPHLRARKATAKTPYIIKQQSKQSSTLTPQGYARLKSQLAKLEQKLPRIAEEIQNAAADKDFKENAPLQAARERKEQLEAQIRDLESAIKSAVVDEKPIDTLKVRFGCRVALRNLSSGEELNYTLVSPRETEPAKDKLSIASPIGKALLNHCEGEIVEVTAPIGKLRYRIERIEF